MDHDDLGRRHAEDLHEIGLRGLGHGDDPVRGPRGQPRHEAHVEAVLPRDGLGEQERDQVVDRDDGPVAELHVGQEDGRAVVDVRPEGAQPERQVGRGARDPPGDGPRRTRGSAAPRRWPGGPGARGPRPPRGTCSDWRWSIVASPVMSRWVYAPTPDWRRAMYRASRTTCITPPPPRRAGRRGRGRRARGAGRRRPGWAAARRAPPRTRGGPPASRPAPAGRRLATARPTAAAPRPLAAPRPNGQPASRRTPTRPAARATPSTTSTPTAAPSAPPRRHEAGDRHQPRHERQRRDRPQPAGPIERQEHHAEQVRQHRARDGGCPAPPGPGAVGP